MKLYLVQINGFEKKKNLFPVSTLSGLTENIKNSPVLTQ